ncbi:hypothetical protein, partial [Klebsiella pneumoniae]|uniref:hypothetical protein n=1 Tax=Klebsiella pneumoniae TaxID=573 RepID=UPI003BEA8235
RFLGFAFDQPASILDYLPANTLVAIDEIEQCHAHGDRWVENADEQWLLINDQLSTTFPKIHIKFEECLAKKVSNFST